MFICIAVAAAPEPPYTSPGLSYMIRGDVGFCVGLPSANPQPPYSNPGLSYRIRGEIGVCVGPSDHSSQLQQKADSVWVGIITI